MNFVNDAQLLYVLIYLYHIYDEIPQQNVVLNDYQSLHHLNVYHQLEKEKNELNLFIYFFLPVAFTSNTEPPTSPPLIVKTDTSNVPPPRS